MKKGEEETRGKKKQQRLVMEDETTDLDFAFHLQMEEAMNDSLIHHDGDTVVDLQTLQLLHKLEEERRDAEQWEIEVRRLQLDLKRRVHDQKFAQEILQVPEATWQIDGAYIAKPFSEEGGSSSSNSKAVVDEGLPLRLYFKGLYRVVGESEGLEKGGCIAAIGAALCDPRGDLMLNVQKPLLGDWRNDWEGDDLVLKVEIKALIDGLTAALSLDIKRIDIYCDYYPLYQYITSRWLITQQKIATMVDQVFLLQRKFISCRAYFVAKKDVMFALKLARDAIDSQIIRSAESSRTKNLRETCRICLEDTDVEQMFAVDSCLHRFCLSCMKQHAEVKLLHGMIPGCPHEGCKTQLNIHSTRKYLTPELLDLMHKRMEEASIPATEKLYCPYPKCSALMSKTDVLNHATVVSIGSEQSGARNCTKCQSLFCINCKVPWHINISCHEYRRLNPNSDAGDAKLKSLATNSSWRQCVRCKHMIELSEGCYHITCRCGYEFCYTCGAEWRNKKATCLCPIWDEGNIVNEQRRRM